MISGHRFYSNNRDDGITLQELNDVEDKIGVADAAVIVGDEATLDIVTPLLSEAEQSFLAFRNSQLSNEFDLAVEHLKNCVLSSRASGQRDHALEARARMEWGLLRFTQGEKEEAGVDLKWAMERFKVLSEGSRDHGLAILNMAAWHQAGGEKIMAMAQLAQIDRNSTHEPEIIALSRLNLSKLFFEVGDLYSAQRHAWVAVHAFFEAEMIETGIEAGILWLDISLSDVSESAITMEELISEIEPRELGDKVGATTNPSDILLVLEMIEPHLSGEFSGTNRPDLCVLVEAENAVNISSITSKIAASNGVEDEELIALIA